MQLLQVLHLHLHPLRLGGNVYLMGFVRRLDQLIRITEVRILPKHYVRGYVEVLLQGENLLDLLGLVVGVMGN
tara:strand:+ start:843 stop:1061 length:219 start_codon:yes stop_codon:yes gene_type:complete